MGPYFRLSFCWKFPTYAIGRYYYLHFTNKKAETQAARLRPHRKGATEPGTLNPVTGTPRSLLVPPTPPLGFSPTLSGVACEAGCSTTVRFSVIAAGGRASGSLKADDPGKGCGGRVCSFLRSVTHFTAPCSRQSGHGLAASHRRRHALRSRLQQTHLRFCSSEGKEATQFRHLTVKASADTE